MFYPSCVRKTINAALPNEQGIGLTVGRDRCTGFSKMAGEFKSSLYSYRQRDLAGSLTWDLVNTI